MLAAVRPGGLVLDLQVIRPHPVIEDGGEPIGVIDGSALFRLADAAAAAVDDLVAAGGLVDEAVDDHDVLIHYPSGQALVEHVAGSWRSLPEGLDAVLLPLAHPLVVRERCRTRRLRVGADPDDGSTIFS